MTVTSAADRRAAAHLRRQAADDTRHARGDIAYRAFRSAAPGIGVARQVPMKTEVRAVTETRNGKELVHTSGFFTRYEQPYPMWDMYGEYDETVKRGSGARSLAARPDVAWLVNHKGVTMARTTNGTLELEERDEGAWHDAWLNPKRQDVHDIIVAIEDRSVDQMSYAFVIPNDGGWWNDDFTAFDITEWDINRGDVSAVNYGANPYTDIAARTAEVLADLDHLPAGALLEASTRIGRRADAVPLQQRGRIVEERERITVRSPGSLLGPRPAPGAYPARLAGRVARTFDRAERDIPGVKALNLRNGRLDWYRIRNADGHGSDRGDEPDTATVFIFDEIGGSMGVDAKTFAMDLEQITAKNIAVRINSPGGSVFDGVAIASALLHHDAHKTVYVDGYACSIASVIAMAGDEIVMMPGAQMMIHDASAVVEGNADDMARMVQFLDRQSDNIADMYVRVGGGTREEWRALMLAETWMFADEAVEAGLADRVAEVERRGPVDERMARSFDLTRFGYRYDSRQSAPAPTRRDTTARPSRFARGGLIADRIEASSLGTPDAVAMRERTDPAAARTIVERSQQVTATHDRATGRSIAVVEAMLDLDK